MRDVIIIKTAVSDNSVLLCMTPSNFTMAVTILNRHKAEV
jgi:hypothetical protein